MLRILMISLVILGSSSSAFAAEDKVKTAIYSALTHVIGFTGRPVVSKTAATADVKTSSLEALSELCFHAGSLQMKIWTMPRITPYMYQASEPMRTKLFTFIDSSQESLRIVCETNDVTARMKPEARVALVQARMIEVLNAAAELRSSLGMQHARR